MKHPNADKPWIVSKHQDRFGMADIGDLQKLYLRYRDLLIDNGWEEAKRWTYGRDFFHSGVKISSSARRYYWNLGSNSQPLKLRLTLLSWTSLRRSMDLTRPKLSV